MKHKSLLSHILIAGILLTTSCSKLADIPDPNNPWISSVTTNASAGQFQNLVTGLEARSADYVSAAQNVFGTFARDIWYFNSNDSRNIQYWLGQGGRKPDADFFGTEDIYSAPYAAIKQANILISSVNNTSSIT